MQTIVASSPIDIFVSKLESNKHYCEFKMTDGGFTDQQGHYYSPAELTMVNVYSFPDTDNREEISFVYILRDENRLLGYCVDTFSECSANEASLYSWFIRKVQRDFNSN